MGCQDDLSRCLDNAPQQIINTHTGYKALLNIPKYILTPVTFTIALIVREIKPIKRFSRIISHRTDHNETIYG